MNIEAKLQKLLEKQGEITELSLEAERRRMVAQTKFFGWLIEEIEQQRKILKKELAAKLGDACGLLNRINSLLSSIALEFLSPSTSEKNVRNLKEIYEQIRLTIYDTFKDDPAIYRLPYISYEVDEPKEELKKLYACSSQLSGFVIGKLIGVLAKA